MTSVLALDLGSASLGWALIGNHRIVSTGVRVFPEGVDRDKQGGELSKNEQRRIARGQRRQIARRAKRKRVLRKALVEAGLYPNDPDEQLVLDEQDPYELRRRALDEALHPHEIGRILIHLNQHRGFLSNRKAEREKKREDSKILKSISDLAERISAGEDRTLGEHLARHTAKPGEVTTTEHRVRGQHTRRDMYEQEFNAIWEAQREFHPQLLTDKLKYGAKGPQSFPADPTHREGGSPLQQYGIHGIIFFQRKMYWPEEAVGFCELEPRLRRCPRADRLAQKARLFQEVNNLRLIDAGDQERELTPDEREKLLAYLRAEESRTFDEIRKHLGLLERTRFKQERLTKDSNEPGGRTKLKGMETDALLANKKLFGKAWHDRPEDEKDEIVRTLLTPSVDEHELFDLAIRKWGLTHEQADRLLDLNLPSGYVKLSRKALGKLLPHLEAGLPLMRNDPAANGAANDALHAAGYLRPDERQVKTMNHLPGPGQPGFPDLPNPLVQQALHEVRRVVNAIIREYGKPDAIHVELAREVKGSLEQRRERRLQQVYRERRRDEAAAKIREHGVGVNREAINRYLLWEEQDRTCIYSGRPISMAKLFGGEIDIDHILPYPQSLDNSMANKVVCFRRENEEKGNQTPRGWLEETQPERYAEVLQRARKLGHYGKYRKFLLKNVDRDEFINRQLVDTAYITRAVVQYLQYLGVDVLGTKGQLTADLRRCWGLNTVLRHDDLDVKNREDHRHHAVDAVVIALTDRSCLQKLARLRETGEVVPDPWKDFRQDVEQAVNSIQVSHRVQRGVRGALHEETIYGAADLEAKVYVSRQPLESLTPAMVPLIRDRIVREKVTARLAHHGIEVGRGKGSIAKKVWTEPEPLWMNREKAVQIKKVRVGKPEESIVPLRDVGPPYVKPGKLHHVCLFEIKEGRKTKRIASYVTMLEAAKRKKRREPIVQRHHPDYPNAKFLMSLSPGDSVLVSEGDIDRLMIVSTLVSTQQRIHLVDARDARRSSDKKDVGKTPNSFNGRKVTVDPLGRIRWAND